MDIKKIDKNFDSESDKVNAIEYYEIPNKNFDLYGVKHGKNGFFRMTEKIAENVSAGVKELNYFTAGGRLRFRTNAKEMVVSATYESLCMMPHMPFTGSGGFTLTKKVNGESVFVANFMPDFSSAKGFTASREIGDGKMCEYTLYFPLYQAVSSLKIGFNAQAEVQRGEKYQEVLPILYYGSSITEGGCASRADNSYQSIIEKGNNIDYINLGFSGNGMAEPIMAEYLSEIKCSVFVCDYDYNAPSVSYLKETHYKLYEQFRKEQKATPIIFVSKPDFWSESAAERFSVIKRTYNKAKKLGDNNVYLINGKSLFGKNQPQSCTVDGCHPNDLGFYRMAEKIGKVIKTALKQK